MMYKIFGIPNCDTVKKARSFLEKKGIDVEFVDFKKTKISKEDILRWKEAFGSLPVNVKGSTYRKLKDEFEGLPEEEKMKFIQANTSLIKRPILQKNDKVLAFGFDEKEYKNLFL